MSTESNENLPDRLPAQKSIVLREIERQLDLLPEREREELRKQLAGGMIDVGIYAAKLGVEVEALRIVLNDMARETQVAAREGIHVTGTRTQKDTLGTTEWIIGNTDAAKAGKLSRSQSGLPDYTLAYIIAAVILVIVIAMVAR